MSERRVVVLVGTDHHPFERAVVWADARHRTHPEETVVVQHGQTVAPSYAAGHSFLSRDDMYDLIAGATVVITHGGPGTINDARSGGHRPIVLARNPAHGEHVDDHQMRFAAWCGQRGLIRLVTDLDELDAMVAALGETGTREDLTTDEVPPGVAVLEALATAPRSATRAVLPGSPVVLAVAAASGQQGGVLQNAFLDIPGALLLGRTAELPELLADPASTCACGKAVDDCVFWGEVLDRAGTTSTDAGPEAATGERLLLRHVVRRRLPRSRRRDLVARTTRVDRLVRTAVEVSGARFAVDGSDLTGVLTLGRAPGLDVRVAAAPHAGPAARVAVAAARHARLPVLTMSGRPGVGTVARRLAALPLPPGGEAGVDHELDVRLTRD